MKIDKDSLAKSALEHDRVFFGGALEETEFLIKVNPFAATMAFLLSHQEAATLPTENMRHVISPPNCIGTALFIAGLSLRGTPYHAYFDEIEPHLGMTGEMISVLEVMRTHTEQRVAGAFVFSPSLHSDDHHVGIYLGQIGNEHIAFAQHGLGQSFGIERISRNYDSPDYHIPSTLTQNNTLILEN